MNIHVSRYDSIVKIIYDEGLCIEAVNFHSELDVMLLVLNTKAVLRQWLSYYDSLKSASMDALLNFESTGKGTGIHGPQLGEDLSLKGFLRDELLKVVKKDTLAA